MPTIDVPTGLPSQELNNNLVTIEKWESVNNLEVHLASPHILAYKGRVEDIIDQVSLKVLEEI